MILDGASVSIGAGATVNVFAGRPAEYPAGNGPTVMRLMAIADAALISCQLLQNVGANQIAPIASGASVNVASAAGAGPKDDEDTLITNLPVPQGTRQAFNVTNPTGGAIIMRWRAQLL